MPRHFDFLSVGGEFGADALLFGGGLMRRVLSVRE
jgi:hypothetical protein